MMWSRYCEIVLGLWLIASPWWFEATGEWFWSSTVCGLVTVALAGASFWPRTRRAHLGTLVVVAWLCGHGWYWAHGPQEATAVAQNEIVLGLLLAVFVIVPSDAFQPPPSWRSAVDG